MRRLIVAGWLLSGCGLACVSDDSARSPVPSYPIHRVCPQRDITQPRPTHADRTLQPWSPDAAAWYPSGRRISPRWTYIVIHHSATEGGGARRFDNYHRQRNGWDELGYHFVIGNGTDTPDGFVEVGPRWHKQKHGAHCKTPDNYYNEHGIGICMVGDFTKTRPTKSQLASLEHLVRFLCDRCGIPPERVTIHGAIKENTRCPGQHFQLATLRRAVVNLPTATSLP